MFHHDGLIYKGYITVPTLDFKGKNYVYSHHLSVPFRSLEVDAKKSKPIKGSKPNMDDNLIIQGDNLHALKALLPKYAGKIKCIYIDPPYNTGNEGWCYNDKVNSPTMREWLKDNANPVDKDDLERHDKWLCMMWPRLQLLRELLSDEGVIFISIDDIEVNNLRLMMDELFGDDNFVASFIWKSRQNKDNRNKSGVSVDHEYVVCFAKNLNTRSFRGDERKEGQYTNPDHDPRGNWSSANMVGLLPEDQRPNCHYDLVNPETGINYGKPNMGWRYDQNTMGRLIQEDRILWPASEDGRPRRKLFVTELENEYTGYSSLIGNDIYTRTGTKELREYIKIDGFEFPKPHALIKDFIVQTTGPDDLVLDSFAGSGTTAHAVLAINKEDGGNRKFILVEMEDYANDITAERVRRVIDGVPNVKDEALKNGLGGSFTYCKLGDEFDVEKILSGESLPSYTALASYVFYTVTGQSLNSEVKESSNFFIGETDLFEVYLIYKDDISYLRSNGSALNQEKLDVIAAHKPNNKKQKVVFASAKYMSQDALKPHNIVFCQIPYAIHKIAGN